MPTVIHQGAAVQDDPSELGSSAAPHLVSSSSLPPSQPEDVFNQSVREWRSIQYKIHEIIQLLKPSAACEMTTLSSALRLPLSASSPIALTFTLRRCRMALFSTLMVKWRLVKCQRVFVKFLFSVSLALCCFLIEVSLASWFPSGLLLLTGSLNRAVKTTVGSIN